MGASISDASASAAHGSPAVPYTPPQWATCLRAPEHGRVRLANLPTPVVPWRCPELAELGVEWWIKRDDWTGAEITGNKARKLEFLMAEALALGHDCVVTIGGLQSNHCRATAAAARMVGIEPHLVLLVPTAMVNKEIGMEGNLLIDRLLGAKLHLVTGADYHRYGGNLEAMDKLVAAASAELVAKGRKPYIVPVGGTTPVGTWGYIEAVQELCEQQASGAVPEFQHLVLATGSGGTAAGLAIGRHLAGQSGKLHAVNVQHDPEEYYRVINAESRKLGLDGCAQEWLTVHNGGDLGYAVTSPEQLAFVARVAAASGILLDHVYTGKALFYFVKYAEKHPEDFRGKRILFWHTGGLPGLHSQGNALINHMESAEHFHPP